MARSVKFNFSNIILESEITKVDRKKLYGSSKKIIKDSNGNECLTSDLYEGFKVLPKGSISQILLNKDGDFVNRSELVGFNNENKKVKKVDSIFNLINTCSKVNIDEFLTVNVKSIYILNVSDESYSDWQDLFNKNEIFIN